MRRQTRSLATACFFGNEWILDGDHADAAVLACFIGSGRILNQGNAHASWPGCSTSGRMTCGTGKSGAMTPGQGYHLSHAQMWFAQDSAKQRFPGPFGLLIAI